MASEVEDLSIEYEEDGIVLVKQLDKEVLSKGAWSTVIFRYQDWDRAKEMYSADRYSIRRYRKISGQYIQQSKFNISSAKQAQKLIEILGDWLS